MNNRDNQRNFRKAFRKQIRKEQIKEFAQINKLKRQSAAWDSSFHLGDIVKFKSDSIEIEEISNIKNNTSSLLIRFIKNNNILSFTAGSKSKYGNALIIESANKKAFSYFKSISHIDKTLSSDEFSFIILGMFFINRENKENKKAHYIESKRIFIDSMSHNDAINNRKARAIIKMGSEFIIMIRPCFLVKLSSNYIEKDYDL